MTERKAPARKPRTKKAAVPEPTVEPDPTPETEPDNGPGFVGAATDPTPNENYTLAGVIAGLPVPETDK